MKHTREVERRAIGECDCGCDIAFDDREFDACWAHCRMLALNAYVQWALGGEPCAHPLIASSEPLHRCLQCGHKWVRWMKRGPVPEEHGRNTFTGYIWDKIFQDQGLTEEELGRLKFMRYLREKGRISS